MNKLWRILLVCFMMSLTAPSWARTYDDLAKVTWTPHMLWAVNFAYDEGSKYGLANTARAVIYTESTACKNKVGTDKHSYGCGQLKYKTANKIYTLYDFATILVSIQSLKTNDHLNIIIATQYLDYCYQIFKSVKMGYLRTLACYNRGEYRAAKMTHTELVNDSYILTVINYRARFSAIRMSHD